MFTPKTSVSKGTMSVPPPSPVSAPRKPTATETSQTNIVNRRIDIASVRSPAGRPPAMHCDPGPKNLHRAEGPCTLQEPINGRQKTGRGKSQNVSRRALLQRIKNHHCDDSEQAEQGEWIQMRVTPLL